MVSELTVVWLYFTRKKCKHRFINRKEINLENTKYKIAFSFIFTFWIVFNFIFVVSVMWILYIYFFVHCSDVNLHCPKKNNVYHTRLRYCSESAFFINKHCNNFRLTIKYLITIAHAYLITFLGQLVTFRSNILQTIKTSANIQKKMLNIV